MTPSNFNFLSNLDLFTESNALAKSQNNTRQRRPLLNAEFKRLFKLNSASEIFFVSLNPYWQSVKILYWLIYSVNWCFTIFSKTLEHVLNRLIGRKFYFKEM